VGDDASPPRRKYKRVAHGSVAERIFPLPPVVEREACLRRLNG
jgi:hypothetical protein